MAEITPRGFRNNNPLNIRKGSNWKGLSPVQSDKSFCVFSTMRYGIRAAIYLLLMYYKVYGLHTLYEIISRWAPATENNTYNYCSIVSHELGLSFNFDLDLIHDYDRLYRLLCAMIYVENGKHLNVNMIEFFDILENEIPSFLK